MTNPRRRHHASPPRTDPRPSPSYVAALADRPERSMRPRRTSASCSSSTGSTATRSPMSPRRTSPRDRASCSTVATRRSRTSSSTESTRSPSNSSSAMLRDGLRRRTRLMYGENGAAMRDGVRRTPAPAPRPAAPRRTHPMSGQNSAHRSAIPSDGPRLVQRRRWRGQPLTFSNHPPASRTRSALSARRARHRRQRTGPRHRLAPRQKRPRPRPASSSSRRRRATTWSSTGAGRPRRGARRARHRTGRSPPRCGTPGAGRASRDVAAISQALVVLDQRYRNTPGWEPLAQSASARLGGTRYGARRQPRPARLQRRPNSAGGRRPSRSPGPPSQGSSESSRPSTTSSSG